MARIIEAQFGGVVRRRQGEALRAVHSLDGFEKDRLARLVDRTLRKDQHFLPRLVRGVLSVGKIEGPHVQFRHLFAERDAVQVAVLLREEPFRIFHLYPCRAVCSSGLLFHRFVFISEALQRHAGHGFPGGVGKHIQQRLRAGKLPREADVRQLHEGLAAAAPGGGGLCLIGPFFGVPAVLLAGPRYLFDHSLFRVALGADEIHARRALAASDFIPRELNAFAVIHLDF